MLNKIESGDITKEKPRQLTFQKECLETATSTTFPKSILKNKKQEFHDNSIKKSFFMKLSSIKRSRGSARNLSNLSNLKSMRKKSVSFKNSKKDFNKLYRQSVSKLSRSNKEKNEKKAIEGLLNSKSQKTKKRHCNLSNKSIEKSMIEDEAASEKNRNLNRESNEASLQNMTCFTHQKRNSSLRKSRCFKCGDIEKIGVPLPKKELFRKMSKNRYLQEKQRKLDQKRSNLKRYTFKLKKRSESTKVLPIHAHSKGKMSSFIKTNHTPTDDSVILEYKNLIKDLDRELRFLEEKKTIRNQRTNPISSVKSRLDTFKTYGIQTVLDHCFQQKRSSKETTVTFPVIKKEEMDKDPRFCKTEGNAYKVKDKDLKCVNLSNIKIDIPKSNKSNIKCQTIHREQVIDLRFYHDVNFL